MLEAERSMRPTSKSAQLTTRLSSEPQHRARGIRPKPRCVTVVSLKLMLAPFLE